MPKVGIISQARMTSTRLPGKVLKEINGKSLLQYHIERLRKAGLPLVLATTTNQTDDVLVSWASRQGVPYFRGSEADVLSRFFGAAAQEGFEHIMRVTSDCPLVDSEVLRTAVDEYLALGSDQIYFSNALKRTFPRGMDFEIFSFKMLMEAQALATQNFEREHVSPYFYKSHPEKFKLVDFLNDSDHSGYRLTVDEADDFKLMELLIGQYGCAEKSVSEIVRVLERHPELAKINQWVDQKKV